MSSKLKLSNSKYFFSVKLVNCNIHITNRSNFYFGWWIHGKNLGQAPNSILQCLHIPYINYLCLPSTPCDFKCSKIHMRQTTGIKSILAANNQRCFSYRLTDTKCSLIFLAMHQRILWSCFIINKKNTIFLSIYLFICYALKIIKSFPSTPNDE